MKNSHVTELLNLPVFILPLIEWGLYCNHLVRLSVRSHFRNRYLGFYGKKWFYIWYMALAWWLVPCLPFPGLLHIYFLFTVWLIIFHVCRNENFRNSYLSFYWKKWFYIWYMALAWWLVPSLPFPGLPHIYFLFTVRLTNERVGVFLARRSVQHLVFTFISIFLLSYSFKSKLQILDIDDIIHVRWDCIMFMFINLSLVSVLYHTVTP
jgi:hypothetical protein